MVRTRKTQGNRGGSTRLTFMAIALTIVVFGTQGCCSSCKYIRSGPVTHTVALAENMALYSCPAVTCVCPVPKGIKVRPGDTVRFENTSQYDVKIKPSMDGVFTIPGEISVKAKHSAVRVVSDPLPDGSGSGIGTDLIVVAPGTPCPGLPGPAIDFD